MKKFKHFLFALLCVAMGCALALSTACSSCNGDDEQPAAPVLQSISLNTDSVKKTYGYEEVYTSAGLVVTAKYDKGDDKVVTDKATIDSSALNSSEDGTYEIKVSYTEGGVTKDASYSVTVKITADGTGIDVQLAEGVEDTITLSATATTATIDTTAIVVKSVAQDGSTRKVLEASEYEVELWKGSEKCESATGLTEGVYQIVVTKPYYADETYIIWAHVSIYVLNPLTGITFKSDGAVTTQSAGTDKISANWTYTATYATGATKNLTASDVKTTINTMTVGENLKAKVEYSEEDAKGTLTTVETEVTYTITEGSPVITQSIIFSDLEAMDTGKGDAYKPFNGELKKGETGTGFYAISKSQLRIDASSNFGYTKRLNFGGAIDSTTGGNSVYFNVGKGTTTITVKYSQAAGRYLDLYKSTDNGTTLTFVADSSSVQTSVDSNSKQELKTYSFKVTLEEAARLYIGSHSGGIYIWEITAVTE